MIEFMIWASVYLAIVALVYRSWVKKVASPAQGRGFILTGTILSKFMAGLVFLPADIATLSPSIGNFTLPEVVVSQSAAISRATQEVSQGVHSATLLIYISLAITAFLLLKMAISVLLLLISTKRQSSSRMGDYTLVKVNKPMIPFSFFHYVFIPEGVFTDEELEMVLVHERAHIRKRHSLDLLLLELSRLLFWFHPGIWYLCKQIKVQHELEADQQVMSSDVNKRAYQHMLLNMNLQSFNYSLINLFNHSPLKYRIMMMNRKEKQHRIRAIAAMMLIIPIFGLAAIIQSCSHEDNGRPSNIAVEESETVPQKTQADYEQDVIFTVVEDPPRFPGGEPARVQFMQHHLLYPEEAREAGIEGTVFLSFVVEKDGSISNISVLRGIGGGCDEEAVRVVSMMPNWEPALKGGEPVRVQFNMPIRFSLN